MLLDARPSRDAYTAVNAALLGWHDTPWRSHDCKELVTIQVNEKPEKPTSRLDNAVKLAPIAVGAVDFTILMQRVCDHQDRGAFSQVFQHFAPRIKAFLMKSGSDAALAEELAQDVMATVWQKSAQFDPARASLATWVFTIARNRRIDYFRRARRPEPETLDWGNTEEPDQADVYETVQETRRLTAALLTLPEAQRAIIERAFYGDLSHGEIAAQTGLPLGTIKSRIRLALERLRQSMSD